MENVFDILKETSVNAEEGWFLLCGMWSAALLCCW